MNVQQSPDLMGIQDKWVPYTVENLISNPSSSDEDSYESPGDSDGTCPHSVQGSGWSLTMTRCIPP